MIRVHFLSQDMEYPSQLLLLLLLQLSIKTLLLPLCVGDKSQYKKMMLVEDIILVSLLIFSHVLSVYLYRYNMDQKR